MGVKRRFQNLFIANVKYSTSLLKYKETKLSKSKFILYSVPVSPMAGPKGSS